MTSNRQDALLKEYQVCAENVTRLDNLIWQTAAIIFPITLAGFAFFGSSATHTIEQCFVISATGLGSIALLATWYLLSRRWYAYERLAFYRMREIEEELGLWYYRYSFIVRKTPKKRKHALMQVKEGEREKFEKMSNYVGNVPLIGLRRTTAIITVVFIVGWLGLVAYEFILAL